MNINRTGEICCYICWEEKTTPDDPIRRDCGCKGTAGWVHVSCLSTYVETTSRINLLNCLLGSWAKCTQCLQPYKDPMKATLETVMLANGTKRAVSSALECVERHAAGLYIVFNMAYFQAYLHLVSPWIESMRGRSSLNPETRNVVMFVTVVVPTLAVLLIPMRLHNRPRAQNIILRTSAFALVTRTLALAEECSMQNAILFLSCFGIFAYVGRNFRIDMRREAVGL